MTILFSEQLETVRRFYVGDYNDLILCYCWLSGGNKLEGVKDKRLKMEWFMLSLTLPN